MKFTTTVPQMPSLPLFNNPLPPMANVADHAFVGFESDASMHEFNKASGLRGASPLNIFLDSIIGASAQPRSGIVYDASMR